jgi:hypothetical protein
MGNMTNVYIILIRKPTGYKTIRRRPRHRLKYNIKIYLKGDVYEGVNFIKMVQDMVQWHTLINTVMNISVPQKAGNF